MSNLKIITDLSLVPENSTKKLGHNTYAHRKFDPQERIDLIVVQYHGNSIFWVDSANRTVTLTGAGWNSQTTATRLNMFLNKYIGNGYFVTSRNNQKEYGLFLRNQNDSDLNVDIQDSEAVFYLDSANNLTLI